MSPDNMALEVIVVTHDHRTLDVFDTIYEMEDGVIGVSEPQSNH